MYNFLALFVLFLCCGFISAFNNEIVPSCLEEDEECEFNFKIDYKFSMMYYISDHSSLPVVIRNNTVSRRSLDRKTVFFPMTKEELEMVITGDGSYHLLAVVNGEMPGTPIVVYEGQTVVVNVKNDLFNEGLTIHWHGMVQKDTPWMDGASMITQCPINSGQTFQYRFKAEPQGTHWYHAHQGSLRTDGLYGPLIVLPRSHKQREDIPQVESEFMLMLQDWNRNKTSMWTYQVQHWNMHEYYDDFNCSDCYKGTHGADGSVIGVAPFHSAVINGKGHFFPHNGDLALEPALPLETFRVRKNKYYRFRVVNTAMLFSFRLSIDGHEIGVIATDGNDVELEPAQSVIISSGERFDILIKTDAKVDNYWIRAETIEIMDIDNQPRKPGYTLAVLRYDGAPEVMPTTTATKCTKERVCKVLNCPYLIYAPDANIQCMYTTDFRSTKESLERNPVPIPHNGRNIREDFFNFHYAGPKKATSVNARRFVFPSCPPQVTYRPSARVCFDDCQDHDCNDKYCECTNTFKYDQEKPDTAVQMVWINIDNHSGGMNHPMHMHGHHFHVLKIGFPEVDMNTGIIYRASTDITCEGYNCSRASWTFPDWNGGHIPGLNLRDPPIKDTVTVPRKGYAVIRFRLDNPGYWLVHCHMEAHQLEGMTMIIKEGLHADQMKPPEGFPTCGNFKMRRRGHSVSSVPLNKQTELPQSSSSGSDMYMTQSTFVILASSLSVCIVALVILTVKLISLKRKFNPWTMISPRPVEKEDSLKKPLLSSTDKHAGNYIHKC